MLAQIQYLWYNSIVMENTKEIKRNGLTYGRGYVYSLQYHLVWCTKYRKNVLVGNIAEEIEAGLKTTAEELGITIDAMEVMPDHIHMLIQAKPQIRLSDAIKDDRAYDFLVLRFRDGCTLQMIAEKENLSRERIRQLLEKYIKRLRHPDILRFLDCGIENIPERTSKTILDRLNAENR